jgi:hypothetical protein
MVAEVVNQQLEEQTVDHCCNVILVFIRRWEIQPYLCRTLPTQDMTHPIRRGDGL